MADFCNVPVCLSTDELGALGGGGKILNHENDTECFNLVDVSCLLKLDRTVMLLSAHHICRNSRTLHLSLPRAMLIGHQHWATEPARSSEVEVHTYEKPHSYSL